MTNPSSKRATPHTMAVSRAIMFAIIAVASTTAVYAQVRPVSIGHAREVIRSGQARAIGKLPSEQMMSLDLVLPLRDEAGLDDLLKEIYDPASASYRQFLTVQQFTARFGPTQADYDAVVEFAKTHGFKVTGGTRDGMEVQVRARVSAVEAAFHVSMRTYRHPIENRAFFAPDRDATVDGSVKISHVSGLDNYSIPHPAFVARSDYAAAQGVEAQAVLANATSGSGPGGSFLGSDMRAAYYGGAALRGTGQHLGLLEFYYGTNLADLRKYFRDAGEINSVPVTVLSTDGTKTSCYKSAGCDDTEQTLDMTQAISMAPGLASLVMYVGSTDTAILSAMTTHHPLATTIGCSWNWWGDPIALNPYFKRMAAQGQTFLAATGDEGTWGLSTALPWPADGAFVVSVGGTDLTTSGAAGSWASEKAWVDGGGGVSPDLIAIPVWQKSKGVITAVNGGSKVYRNGPDVAANASRSFYTCANQTACRTNVGGTSFAAAMWAGFIALVNQQRHERGTPPIGFINPKIYANNVTSRYTAGFHDIQQGKAGSTAAVKGYDLATGWGSPKGQLINVLAP